MQLYFSIFADGAEEVGQQLSYSTTLQSSRRRRSLISVGTIDLIDSVSRWRLLRVGAAQMTLAVALVAVIVAVCTAA